VCAFFYFGEKSRRFGSTLFFRARLNCPAGNKKLVIEALLGLNGGVRFIIDIFARSAACLLAAAFVSPLLVRGKDAPREDVPWVSLAHQRELAKKAAAASASAEKKPAAKKAEDFPKRPEVTADTFEYSADGSGMMVAKGNAQMRLGDIFLSAGKITYLSAINAARVLDDVCVSSDKYRIITSAADISISDNVVESGYARFGAYPLFVESDSISGEKGKYELGNAKTYFGEPASGAFNADSAKTSYDSQTRIITMEDVVFKIDRLPVMYLPSAEFSADAKFPYEVKIRASYNGDYGLALQNTVYYKGFEDFNPGVLLDVYTKRSVLFGPAVRYDVAGASNKMKGYIETGFIHDTGGDEIIGVNSALQKIDSDRYFVELRHNQIINDKFSLTAVVSAWSDEFVTRDFRESYFYDNQTPDNFAEAVYYGDMWTASLFTRFAPNNWETVAQRLPEVRADMQPVELFNTGAYLRAFASAAYLHAVDPYGFGYRLADAPSTGRVDAYAGIDRPIQLSQWFKITPVAGARLTSYFSGDSMNDSNYTRVLGQLGFDAQMDIWGQFDFTSQTMGIDGIRHHITPLVSYRYIPAADQGRGSIEMVDYDYYTTYPPILDLASMRNIDDMAALNTMRFGIMNVFETRDGDYGSRELARFDVFADVNFTPRAPALYHKYWDDSPEFLQDYSEIYVNASISPARWLTAGTYTRISPEHSCTPEINTYLTLLETDIAEMTIGTIYLRDSLEQYYLSLEYGISQRYRVFASWHYDSELSKLVYQRYGLRTKVGSTWLIDYYITYRTGSTREDNLSFGVNIVLLGM